MDEKLAKIIKRVNDLRKLATSSNANEAAAAAAAAAKIMDEYRLSEATVEAASGQATEQAINHADPIEVSTGPVIPQWKQMLLSALSAHFGVFILRIPKTVGYTRTGGRKTVSVMTIAGRPSDVEFVRYMYKWVGEEIERLCDKEAPRGAGVAWRSTYRNGAAIGVGVQLQKLRAAQHVDVTNVRAMVFIDQRVEESRKAALAILDPKTKLVQGHFNWGSDRGAYDKGKKAGEGINLSPHLGTGDQHRTKQLGK